MNLSLTALLLLTPEYFLYTTEARRGVRVVEGARLESVCAGNRTEGSNPFLSANIKDRQLLFLNIIDLSVRLARKHTEARFEYLRNQATPLFHLLN